MRACSLVAPCPDHRTERLREVFTVTVFTLTATVDVLTVAFTVGLGAEALGAVVCRQGELGFCNTRNREPRVRKSGV